MTTGSSWMTLSEQSPKHKGVSLTRQTRMTPRVHFQILTLRDLESALPAKHLAHTSMKLRTKLTSRHPNHLCDVKAIRNQNPPGQLRHRPQTSHLLPPTSERRDQSSDLQSQTSDLRPQTSDIVFVDCGVLHHYVWNDGYVHWFNTF